MNLSYHKFLILFNFKFWVFIKKRHKVFNRIMNYFEALRINHQKSALVNLKLFIKGFEHEKIASQSVIKFHFII